MSHELYGCLALTGPGGANVRVSRHWHSAQELTTLTVMEKLDTWVAWNCEGSASTQEHAHHTKWVFTLICTYIFISHTGQNSVALLQYGVAFWYFEAKGKCFFISLSWYSVDISYLHEIIYNVFSEFFHQTPTAAPVFVQRRYLRRILPIKCLW